MLTGVPSLSEGDRPGRNIGRDRLAAFVELIDRRVTSGRRTFRTEAPCETRENGGT